MVVIHWLLCREQTNIIESLASAVWFADACSEDHSEHAAWLKPAEC